jgi:hypothetical protein
MRIPPKAVVTAAVIAAIPFGCYSGLAVAVVAAGGPEFGQWPLFTVGPAIAASVAFARSKLLTPRARLMIMLTGIAVFIVFFRLVGL